MATLNETLIREEVFQELLEPTDLQIQDAPLADQRVTNVFVELVARLLGFGALGGSLLFMAWGWLRLL